MTSMDFYSLAYSMYSSVLNRKQVT